MRLVRRNPASHDKSQGVILTFGTVAAARHCRCCALMATWCRRMRKEGHAMVRKYRFRSAKGLLTLAACGVGMAMMQYAVAAPPAAHAHGGATASLSAEIGRAH